MNITLYPTPWDALPAPAERPRPVLSPPVVQTAFRPHPRLPVDRPAPMMSEDLYAMLMAVDARKIKNRFAAHNLPSNSLNGDYSAPVTSPLHMRLLAAMTATPQTTRDLAHMVAPHDYRILSPALCALHRNGLVDRFMVDHLWGYSRRVEK